MNDNHRLIKDVSNALNYYVHRTRREEAFDSSAVLTPAYDLTQYKLNKLFGYSVTYDKNQGTTAKIPELKRPRHTVSASVSGDSSKADELKLREKFYQDELIYHLKWGKNNATRLNRSKSPKKNNRFDRASSYEKRNKKVAKVPEGMVVMRGRVLPTVTKREKLDIVKLTSKIMSASEDILYMKNAAQKPNRACYQKDDEPRRFRQRDEKSASSKRSGKELSEKEREYEENRLREFDEESRRTLEQNESLEAAEKSAGTRDDDEYSEFEETNYINVEEINEASSGEKVSYRVVVKTGDRLGSSTSAKIYLQIFGERGKTPLVALTTSKTHRVPFRKSNTDVFEIDSFDLGKIKAIQIGHNENDIEYSWFMDYLKIEDTANNVCYNFSCDDWFSTDSRDKCTTRLLIKKSSTSIASDLSSASSSAASSASSTPRSSASKGHTPPGPEPQSTKARSDESSTKSKASSSKTPSRTDSRSTKSQRSRSSSSSSSSRSSSKSTTRGSRSSSSKSSTSSTRSRSKSSKASKKSEKKAESSRSSRKSSHKSSRKSSHRSNSAASSDSLPRVKSATASTKSKQKEEQNKEKKEAKSTKSSSSSSSSSSLSSSNEDTQSRKFNFSPDPKVYPDESEARSGSKANKASRTSLGSNKTDEQLRQSAASNIRVIPTNREKLSSVEAVEMNQLEILKAIIAENPSDILKEDVRGKSLMCIACENGFDSIVKYLADNNESLLTKDTPTGFFPVHLCARYNHLACLKILYDYGATLSVKTNEGQTPLHLAAIYGHLDVVEWLCEHNSDFGILDSNEMNAYDLAHKYKHRGVTNFLAERMNKPMMSGAESTDEEEKNKSKNVATASSSRKSSARSSTSRTSKKSSARVSSAKKSDAGSNKQSPAGSRNSAAARPSSSSSSSSKSSSSSSSSSSSDEEEEKTATVIESARKSASPKREVAAESARSNQSKKSNRSSSSSSTISNKSDDEEDSGFKTINTQQQNQQQEDEQVELKTISRGSTQQNNVTSSSGAKLNETVTSPRRPTSSSSSSSPSVNSSIDEGLVKEDKEKRESNSDDVKSMNYDKFRSKETKSKIDDLFDD